jgi:hypothetical protein
MNTIIIKKERNADPKAKAKEPAPPIKDLICDNPVAQISENAESN